MNGFNFTDRMRKVLGMAREEAAFLNHEYVGTEHILLGLIREGEGVGATVLQNLNVELDELYQKIEAMIKPGRIGRTTGPDLPYTSRGKKVLELSMSEARELNHQYVGTEHLLLGLVLEGKGIAANALLSFGVTLENARSGVSAILGSALRRESMPPLPTTPTRDAAPVSVRLILRYDNGATVTKIFSTPGEAANFLTSQ